MTEIVLSEKTIKLIHEKKVSELANKEKIPLTELLVFFDARGVSGILRLALTQDIQKTLAPWSIKPAATPVKKNTPGLALAISAGVLYAICDGFSSMSTIMQAFLGWGIVAFSVSFGFALLAVGLFLLMQIGSIASYFGVTWYEVPEKVQIALDDRKAIDELTGAIADSLFDSTKITPADAYALHQYIQFRIKKLQKNATEMKKKQESLSLKLLLGLFTVLIALTVFSSGLFLGYSVITGIIALFQLTAPFWLPFAIAPIVGLAALCLFAVTQHAGLRKILERLFGVDQEWIDTLSAPIAEERHVALSQLGKGKPVEPPPEPAASNDLLSDNPDQNGDHPGLVLTKTGCVP